MAEFDKNPLYGFDFQVRRLEALARDCYRCVVCNHDGSQYRLECHHRTYENGSSPKLEDLYILCVRCHDFATDLMRRERYGARRPPSAPETPVTLRSRPVPQVNGVPLPPQDVAGIQRTKPANADKPVVVAAEVPVRVFRKP